MKRDEAIRATNRGTRCPDCNTRLSTKHYDASYEMFECPKCGGLFTYAEILEGEIEEPKAKPVAKGKKRRSEIEEDEEAIAEHEKKMLETPVKQAQIKHHRDELDAAQVLGIWQDEIQEIYEELGLSIDEANARDKALIIWRELYQQGTTAREQAVPHALCKEHS